MARIRSRFATSASCTRRRTLLGNFVDRWFRHYLGVVAENLVELHKGGMIAGLDRPTELGRHMLFDFRALNLEKLAYICGIYTYVPRCHKRPTGA